MCMKKALKGMDKSFIDFIHCNYYFKDPTLTSQGKVHLQVCTFTT